MPSKSPCKYGRKKSARRGCKAKPGPKRSVRRSSRRSARRCARGVKRSPPRKGSCKRKPGPKRSRSSSKRSSRKLKADYGKFLYYIKGKDLWQTPRAKQSGQKKIIKRNAVNKREKGYLYYPKMVNGELVVRRRRMNWN